MNTPKNQHRIGFPLIALNQSWKVVGYLNGKATRKTKLKFSDFSSVQFIGQSGDYYHAIGDSNIVLILTIIINK